MNFTSSMNINWHTYYILKICVICNKEAGKHKKFLSSNKLKVLLFGTYLRCSKLPPLRITFVESGLSDLQVHLDTEVAASFAHICLNLPPLFLFTLNSWSAAFLCDIFRSSLPIKSEVHHCNSRRKVLVEALGLKASLNVSVETKRARNCTVGCLVILEHLDKNCPV